MLRKLDLVVKFWFNSRHNLSLRFSAEKNEILNQKIFVKGKCHLFDGTENESRSFKGNMNRHSLYLFSNKSIYDMCCFCLLFAYEGQNTVLSFFPQGMSK